MLSKRSKLLDYFHRSLSNARERDNDSEAAFSDINQALREVETCLEILTPSENHITYVSLREIRFNLKILHNVVRFESEQSTPTSHVSFPETLRTILLDEMSGNDAFRIESADVRSFVQRTDSVASLHQNPAITLHYGEGLSRDVTYTNIVKVLRSRIEKNLPLSAIMRQEFSFPSGSTSPDHAQRIFSCTALDRAGRQYVLKLPENNAPHWLIEMLQEWIMGKSQQYAMQEQQL